MSLVLWTSTAAAYPWMIRHGYVKCGTCHTDPSGGETLTHMGRVTSQTLLSTLPGDQPLSNDIRFLLGVGEPDSIRLGGSVRGMAVYDVDNSQLAAFPMQADLYGTGTFGPVQIGGSVGLSSFNGRLEHTDKAILYSDNAESGDLVPVSRTHWLGYGVSEDLLIRAGRLNLPFGLRISEHTQWVRDYTLTDRESDQQHGLSLAYTGGAIRAELMAVAGNFRVSPDDYRERGYSGYFEYALDSNLAAGISSQVLASTLGLGTGVPDQVRQAHGVMVRYSPMPLLAILLEADALLTTGRDPGYVGLAYFDLEPLQGVHVMATGEVADRGARVPSAAAAGDVVVRPEQRPTGAGTGEPVLGGWLSAAWFPYPHFDIRIDAVMRQERPLATYGQVHFYF